MSEIKVPMPEHLLHSGGSYFFLRSLNIFKYLYLKTNTHKIKMFRSWCVSKNWYLYLNRGTNCWEFWTNVRVYLLEFYYSNRALVRFFRMCTATNFLAVVIRIRTFALSLLRERPATPVEKISRRDHIDSRDYTSSSKSTKDFVWRPAATVTSPVRRASSRRLFVSAHRVLTLQQRPVGVADDNISTASGDICSGGVSGWSIQKKDSSHKV